MTPSTLIIAFSTLAVLCVVLGTIRRAFRDTPAGHYHPFFLENAEGEAFDEGEKIHRIGVLLALALHVLRIGLIGSFIIYRLQNGAWYSPGPWGFSLTWLPTLGLLIELSVISSLVFELVPQVLVAWKGKAIALRTLPSLAALERAFSPLTWAFRVAYRALLRLVGNGEERSEADVAEDQIRAGLEAGEREGLLLAPERSMIESLLEFRDLEVTEVMTPRTDMVCVPASLTIEEVIPKVISCGHSRIPVFGEDIDDIVGVLYVKDLLRYVDDASQMKLPVEKAKRDVRFVPETKKISELLAEFRSERFHIAIIIDEYSGTSGLVTIEDIIEEIVGEIQDEYDKAETALIRKVGPDIYDLDGRAHVDEVSSALRVEVPDSDDYETIAGFIFCSLGKVPKEGEQFDFDSLRFQITQADEKKIKRVRVQLLEPI